jgi:hypothetical protein
MTEVIKAVIWDRGIHEIEGKKVYKYLIGAILVSDEPIDGIGPGDNIVMGVVDGENDITNSLSRMEKYASPFTLGDLSSAILDIAEMNPEDLTLKSKELESDESDED